MSDNQVPEQVFCGAVGSPAQSFGGERLDLLLDVELPLTVSVGSVDMSLGEVLDLTAGSVVELNQALQDPVDVVVNNRVVARGEVVVVDGYYGIRISEVSAPAIPTAV